MLPPAACVLKPLVLQPLRAVERCEGVRPVTDRVRPDEVDLLAFGGFVEA